MKTDIKEQDVMVTWQNLNPGAIVTGGSTAVQFNTGEWRVDTPAFDVEKCKRVCSVFRRVRIRQFL